MKQIESQLSMRNYEGFIDWVNYSFFSGHQVRERELKHLK
jgi:hypothetical protein